MPLTDPELDLLREMLDDDPAADALLQVGEELVRRCRWADAEEVLTRGVAALQGQAGREGERIRAFELLARAALETAHYDLAATALGHVGTDPVECPENARVRLLVLERSGRSEEALEAARRFLAVQPGDVVVETAIERLEAPPPSARLRAADPFYTVERAERYALIGRKERAIRVYRRILMATAADAAAAAGLELRLRQLQADGGSALLADDLSEELTDPGLVPEEPPPGEEDVLPVLERPALAMPEPSLHRAGPDAERSFVARRAETLSDAPTRPTVHDEVTLEDTTTSDAERTGPGFDPDDEDTDLDLGRSGAPAEEREREEGSRRERRKRRSLIRR